MNIKDSLISISLLTISIFLGIFGIVGIVESFKKLSFYSFSYGALIDYGLGLLFGILILLFARFLYKKARKIRVRISETYEEKKRESSERS